jgi:hypothetical protein
MFRRWHRGLTGCAVKRHALGLGLTLFLGLLATPASGQNAPEMLGTDATIKIEVRKG